MSLSNERLQKSRPAKFFFALASGKKEYLPEVEELISDECCKLGFRSELYRFSDFSSYYDSETGGEVWKYLAGAEGVLSPEEIVRIKRVVEGIQERFLFESDGTAYMLKPPCSTRKAHSSPFPGPMPIMRAGRYRSS